MLDVRPYRPCDLARLQPQAQQAAEMARVGNWRLMIHGAAASGPAWTGWLDGRVIGVAGLALRWPGRASTWCVLAGGIPKSAWPAIHRAVVLRLDQARRELGAVRIEAEVMRGFLAGDRWVRLLGFECEGIARCYGPGGEDFGRYARVTP